MNENKMTRGDFTLPGEAGYEDLTLRLADIWGADTIRDSDGTELSPELLSSGHSIYSTICLVRSVNAWAKNNPRKLQQNYLMSFPVEASDSTLSIQLLDGFSKDQFVVNSDENPKEWWQVFDRTSGAEVPVEDWDFVSRSGGVGSIGERSEAVVVVRKALPRHQYTVNFLVYRVWEEISMYNHVTNNWGDRERLMSVDPVYPETQEVLLEYLESWLVAHPHTTVVRFTSLFYNFCWFWGDDPSLRFVYADWASYDMTVTPFMLRKFELRHGYRPRSEDFVNAGRYNSTHNPPSRTYREWMDFVNGFVTSFGRKCVDLVHKYSKKAFVFYDDHWIGVEPYSKRFSDIGFDGIIKCVFSAFEVRLCAGVRGAQTHEIRLHPYLFPTGLKGEPTFAPDGDPAADARRYWVVARRALLRASIDRIGLGGYLHLVEPFPDFIEFIEAAAVEFRSLKALHASGAPWTAPCRVGILTAWGSLRSWTCSGHMHEQPQLELLRVIEALAGLPFEVVFFDFNELRSDGVPSGVDVVLNAGRAGSAWSGGEEWNDPLVVERIADWVAAGGGLVGVGEPSACPGGMNYFRLASVLGVDREVGTTIARSKRLYRKPDGIHFLAADLLGIDSDDSLHFNRETGDIFVTDGVTEVIAEGPGGPRIAVHPYGAGRTVYLSGFDTSASCFRLLDRAIRWAASKEESFERWTCSNIETECAWFPEARTLAVVNNSGAEVQTVVKGEGGESWEFALPPFGIETKAL